MTPTFIALAIFITIAGLTIHVWCSTQKRPSATNTRIFINGVELTAAILRFDSGHSLTGWEPAETAVSPVNFPVIEATLVWDDPELVNNAFFASDQ